MFCLVISQMLFILKLLTRMARTDPSMKSIWDRAMLWYSARHLSAPYDLLLRWGRDTVRQACSTVLLQLILPSFFYCFTVEHWQSLIQAIRFYNVFKIKVITATQLLIELKDWKKRSCHPLRLSVLDPACRARAGHSYMTILKIRASQ